MTSLVLNNWALVYLLEKKTDQYRKQLKRSIPGQFLQFIKTFVVGTHYKLLTKALLLSTQNISFYGEIRKSIPELP